MILADSSAWIDYFRGDESHARAALRGALTQNIAVLCEPVWAEVMRGAREGRDQERIERAFARVEFVATVREDWENAVTIARFAQRRGVAIRSFLDCLIAGIAVRSRATLLHNDVGFERLAEAFPPLDQTRG